MTTLTNAINANSVSPLKLEQGGTEASLVASNGGMFYSTAGAGAILAGTATAGQIIRSGSNAAPTWSTATYPAASGAVGNVLTSDGTNWISSAASGGTVTSVSGTANRITSTGGTTPVIDISAAYVGQASITTLGTITTGVWQGTLIGETFGGTGQSTYTLGDTLYSSAANTLAKLAGNTTAVKQYLSQTGTGAVSAAPSWATVDGSDITGAALTKTDDTNVTLTLGGTPATALLRAASLTLGWTGLLSLARGGTNKNITPDNGALVYTDADSFELLAATATAGQIPRSGANSAPTWSTATYPAAAGASGNVLTSDGTNWTSAANAGTSPLTTKGDLFTFTTVNARLPVGSTDGQILQVNSGAATGLAWSAPTYPSASGTAGKILRSDGTNNVYTTSTFADTYTASNLLYSNGANTVTGLATANNGVLITSAGGVPSISSTLPQAVLNNISAPTVQTFLSGSGTYTTPANVRWVRVVAVGGGGGGAGSSDSSANGGTGGTGVSSTFGGILVTAGGGSGGSNQASSGGAGGTASLTGSSGIAISGGSGGVGAILGTTALIYGSGGAGGNSGLGGGGSGGQANSGGASGTAGATNTGGGGGGANFGGVIGGYNGAGGGAGGFCDVIVTSPAATYAYVVGTAGTAGTAGTNGTAGSAGGSGGIWVFEHYV